MTFVLVVVKCETKTKSCGRLQNHGSEFTSGGIESKSAPWAVSLGYPDKAPPAVT